LRVRNRKNVKFPDARERSLAKGSQGQIRTIGMVMSKRTYSPLKQNKVVRVHTRVLCGASLTCETPKTRSSCNSYGKLKRSKRTATAKVRLSHANIPKSTDQAKRGRCLGNCTQMRHRSRLNT
jgi:hypothetical protein